MAVYYADDQLTLHHGDALAVLRTLPAGSVDAVVTSPPYYGLRDYGATGQYGLEDTPSAYITTLRAVFGEVARVLRPDGTLWLNLSDSYAGRANAGPSVGATRRADRAEVLPGRRNTTAEAPYKSLLMIPSRLAWALVEDGWRLRNRIVWHKTDAMPEAVRDRLANRYEEVFLLTRSGRYWFDLDPIRSPATSAGPTFAERRGHGTPRTAQNSGDAAALHPGRNPGDVWPIATAGFPGAHTAVMPPALAERCILAGCRPGGTVLDPFCGTGTTGMVALRTGRRYVGIDISARYLDLALRTRLAQTALVDTPARDETPPGPARDETRCGCGTPLQQPATGRRRTHCSPACRTAAHRHRAGRA